MTRQTCEAAPFSGTFIPFLQCQGGRCSNNNGIACGADADCAANNAGECLGNAIHKAQPNPCRVCSDSTTDHCQQNGSSAQLSDTSADRPTRIAEDVLVREQGVLRSICVSGAYDGPAGADCHLLGEKTDQFTVRIFGLDVEGYLPGSRLGGYAATAVDNKTAPTVDSGREWFDYELTLIEGADPLPMLQADGVYFIEVVNQTSGGNSECWWHWRQAADGDGNGLAFQDRGAAHGEADAIAADFSICTNLRIDSPPAPYRACCTGDPYNPCVMASLAECLAREGRWRFDDEGCDIADCAVAANDLCPTAIEILEDSVAFDNLGAGADGPSPESCDGTGENPGADLWFFYTAACDGSALITTCHQEYIGDEIVSVYHDPDAPTVCRCPGDAGFQPLACSDDGQPNHVYSTGCPIAGHADVVLADVAAGNCYTVRISGKDGAATVGRLRITCGGEGECGNGITEPLNGEDCEPIPGEDAACSGACDAECLCPPPICGDGVVQAAAGEQCDPGSPGGDAACPGRCSPPSEDGQSESLSIPCTCRPVCGDGAVDVEGGEECDGSATADDGSLCEPGECRPPGDAAGECTCRCGYADGSAPDPPLPEPAGIDKIRFISFVVPPTTAGTETALRVRLESLHHPPSPPAGTPSFAAFEGEYRYVNGFGLGSAGVTCPDSPNFGTTFFCARLGCQPEYRDWGGQVGGQVLHVTGDAAAPSSVYAVSHIAAACGSAPAADLCAAASAELNVPTAVWGDVVGSSNGPPDGMANVLDISTVVDKVKDLATAFREPRTWLKDPSPDPMGASINVLDIGFTVDAVKRFPYPAAHVITPCP